MPADADTCTRFLTCVTTNEVQLLDAHQEDSCIIAPVGVVITKGQELQFYLNVIVDWLDDGSLQLKLVRQQSAKALKRQKNVVIAVKAGHTLEGCDSPPPGAFFYSVHAAFRPQREQSKSNLAFLFRSLQVTVLQPRVSNDTTLPGV